MKRVLTTCVIAMVAVLAAVGPTRIASAETVTLEAIADHYGKIDDATNVQTGNGDGSTLLIKNASANSRKGWVRFDLSAYSSDVIGGGTFRFRQDNITTNYTGTFGIWALKAGFVPGSGVLDVDWDEDLLTWNNAPGNSLTSKNSFDTADATKIGTINFNTGTQNTGHLYSISIADLTPYLQSSNMSITMMIGADAQSSDSPGFNISSSESPDRAGPELVVSLIPEPASLGVLGVMMAGVLMRRRR